MAKREPDFNNILKVLNRQVPDRPTLFELFMSFGYYERLSGMKLSRTL